VSVGPIRQSIGERFAAVASARGDALAFRGPGAQLTYRQLNARANRLAHRLLAIADSRDQPLAVLAEGGVHQVVAALGLLKAGRIYIVIDPANPPDRVAAILRHAGAEVLLTDGAHAAHAAALQPTPRQIVRLDAESGEGPATEPQVTVDPEAPALVLYTSGSTGRPKGVVHTQHSILSNFMRHADAFHITQDDRQSLLYQLSVYGGTRDLFNAFLSGASLHYFPVRDAGVDGLAAWLLAERITIYCSVASVLRELSAHTAPSQVFPALRLVKVGGEATHAVDIERIREHLPQRCLIHCGLSASETGLVCNYFVSADTALDDGTVPLGHPVKVAEVLIADRSGRPVAPGAVGEIWVRGPCVAKGYWRDETATASAFVAPCNAGPRAFRTGDLAIRTPDGCLEHRGRVDFQVKIRGNRVDPTEIERHLLAHSGCRQVAVAARPGKDGAMRLVAYLAFEGGEAPSLAALRDSLAERLPTYMIPSAFVPLDVMPRTGNGKIDRAALPDPGPERPGLSAPYVAPVSPIEAALCALWGSLLGIESVGTTDHFFDLGGDSLLAAQVIARFRQVRDVPLTVRHLLEHPTVAALSLVVENLSELTRTGGRSDDLEPVDRGSFTSPGSTTTAFKVRSSADD
jgi:amino acid adenylation domain-containing protein